MNLRPYRLRLVFGVAAATALVAAAPGWAAPAPAAAPVPAAVAAAPGDLASTIALSNCSASLVRFPTS
jgi:hypothetical protein